MKNLVQAATEQLHTLITDSIKKAIAAEALPEAEDVYKRQSRRHAGYRPTAGKR